MGTHSLFTRFGYSPTRLKKCSSPPPTPHTDTVAPTCNPSSLPPCGLATPSLSVLTASKKSYFPLSSWNAERIFFGRSERCSSQPSPSSQNCHGGLDPCRARDRTCSVSEKKHPPILYGGISLTDRSPPLAHPDDCETPEAAFAEKNNH